MYSSEKWKTSIMWRIPFEMKITLYLQFLFFIFFVKFPRSSVNYMWVAGSNLAPMLILISFDELFKVALGVSPYFFFIWTRVLNHNQYVEIKQFSKVDIKQNNISTVILLISFLVYQCDPRHLQGSRVVYIFIYIMKTQVRTVSNFEYQS